jgi:hypothetical protein
MARKIQACLSGREDADRAREEFELDSGGIVSLEAVD